MAHARAGNQGIIIGGNARIDAQNIAVGNRARIQVTSDLGRLREAVRALPAEYAREKDDLETFQNSLEAEAKKPNPNKSMLQVSTKGLLEAAKAVSLVAPDILTTAGRVVQWFSSLT